MDKFEYNCYTYKDLITDGKSHTLLLDSIPLHLKETELNKVYYIDLIYVEEKGNGKGSQIMNDFLSKLNENDLCVLLASPTVREFPKEPTEREYLEFFKKIDRFYTKFNFVEINKYIYYEQYRPYVYVGNTVGIKYLESVIKRMEVIR